MTYATIYYLDTGRIATDGVQSSKDCDAAIDTARSIARTRKRSVIVEDRSSPHCYRVTPGGHIWRAPKSWTVED